MIIVCILFLLNLMVIIITGLVLATSFKAPINFHERIGLSILLGMGFQVLLIFLLKLLDIDNSQLLVYIFDLIVVLLFLCVKRRGAVNRSWDKAIKVILKSEFLIFYLVYFLFVVLPSVYQSLVSTFSAWDEFSFWGTAAKYLINYGSLNLSGVIQPFLESYPIFVPLSSSALLLNQGAFYTGGAKLINIVFYSALVFILSGFVSRFSSSKINNVILLLIFIFSGPSINFLLINYFAEISLMAYYGSGLVFMVYFINTKNKSYLYLGSILLGVTSVIKPEGIFLAIFAYAPAMFIARKSTGLVKYINSLLFIISPAIAWKAYTVFNSFGVSGYYKNIKFFNLEKILQVKGAGSSLVKQLFSLNYYYIWYLLVFCIVISLIYIRKNMTIRYIHIVALLNILFLAAVYYFSFSVFEFAVCAEFYRYSTRLLVVYYIIIPILTRILTRGPEAKLPEIY